MVRIGGRKWTAAQIERLILLIDAGSSAASAAVALKRSITVVQTKARSLGKPFQAAASRRWFPAVAADDRQNNAR
jgi:hypothetical protein